MALHRANGSWMRSIETIKLSESPWHPSQDCRCMHHALLVRMHAGRFEVSNRLSKQKYRVRITWMPFNDRLFARRKRPSRKAGNRIRKDPKRVWKGMNESWYENEWSMSKEGKQGKTNKIWIPKVRAHTFVRYGHRPTPWSFATCLITLFPLKSVVAKVSRKHLWRK